MRTAGSPDLQRSVMFLLNLNFNRLHSVVSLIVKELGSCKCLNFGHSVRAFCFLERKRMQHLDQTKQGAVVSL